ncbi:MAG: alpha/beta hydrolase [Novosphingobium sp.]|nr:alpha/beta hydrolase [Novosphingobium sp.]
MAVFTDGYWTSADGLKLHYRDYPGRADRPAIVCLPGLTRNARDFESLAERLSGEWRVVCPEMRGRGDSAYAKDPATYTPARYVEDLGLLFSQPGFGRIVPVGTSLGGLLTMVLGVTLGNRIAGAALNDIGPVIEEAGLARIREYVGQGRSFPTWMHAARALEESQGIAFPEYGIADWLRMAKRVMTLSSKGRIVFDYDMKIAEPFARPDGAAPPDLWPMLDAFRGKPVLLLRGELSDVLSVETFDAMAARLPGAEAVTVARTGHAPTLDEPEAVAGIDRLLARIA